ncbi:NAD(P)-dependent dehydrogenase (short-subunit alcohol dehydrogenase family) [Alkalihalobacillus xiaoxiensis]|uniref:NAD(P)-dependent dehydrogenase (Short-subunit alcohol dehydrogenase family) n=1 Tax=Shouchella xiaoxiensis TaxID=766895 RepID=A0ABS2SVW2_9BACI|nr:short-chain dehydrogenase [Shouchella xiaoxiensis]MBM7839647.1 NAD(P)-dependent dehydrogenase (short-subunit alcohol dehydrogenase family) [Shouchella xiaoxiensis]
MKHALVFGGTGMLAKTTSWLAEQADHTVVFARNKSRAGRISKKVSAIELDYTETEALKALIIKAIEENGPVDLVHTWIHGTAPKGMATIVTTVNQLQDQSWRLIHVKGSSESRESIDHPFEAAANRQVFYQEVKLGFEIENNQSRWLTHQEIADGTMEAISTSVESYTIGTLTPWEKRP